MRLLAGFLFKGHKIMKRLLFWGILLFLAGLFWRDLLPFWQMWQTPVVSPGILAPEAPRQTDLKPSDPFPFDSEYSLVLLAGYDITARILASRIYMVDDGADLIPIDLVLGWQYMSDSAVVSRIDIKQTLRFYWWRTMDPSIKLDQVAKDSANVHIIPASREVKRQIYGLPVGSVVRLKGYLVEARRANGWSWRSSLTRNDTGRGACELIWVTDVERVY